jgi:hypothetical protein
MMMRRDADIAKTHVTGEHRRQPYDLVLAGPDLTLQALAIMMSLV